MEIKQLIDDYIHWLKKEITFEKIGEYYEITTPFLNSANDFIQIYVRIEELLICLRLLEKMGEFPEIGEKWWLQMATLYG